MWNTFGSFGSLRDKVRERATAAAQAAQGVLQAAAAEDDTTVAPSDPTADDKEWNEWGTVDQSQPETETKQSESFLPPSSSLSPPPPPPPPPEDEMLQPPPPPPPSTNPPPTSGRVKPRTRSSRYVVTGLAVSKPTITASSTITPAAPLVPTPLLSTSETVNQQGADSTQSFENTVEGTNKEEQEDELFLSQNEKIPPNNSPQWETPSDPWSEVDTDAVQNDPAVNSNFSYIEHEQNRGQDLDFRNDEGNEQTLPDAIDEIKNVTNNVGQIAIEESMSDPSVAQNYASTPDAIGASFDNDPSVAEIKDSSFLQSSMEQDTKSESKEHSSLHNEAVEDSIVNTNPAQQEVMMDSFKDWDDNTHDWNISQQQSSPEQADQTGATQNEFPSTNTPLESSNEHQQNVDEAFGGWDSQYDEWGTLPNDDQSTGAEKISAEAPNSLLPTTEKTAGQNNDEEQHESTENKSGDWGEEWNTFDHTVTETNSGSHVIGDKNIQENVQKEEKPNELQQGGSFNDSFVASGDGDEWAIGQRDTCSEDKNTTTAKTVESQNQPSDETETNFNWFSGTEGVQEPEENDTYGDEFLQSTDTNVIQANSTENENISIDKQEAIHTSETMDPNSCLATNIDQDGHQSTTQNQFPTSPDAVTTESKISMHFNSQPTAQAVPQNYTADFKNPAQTWNTADNIPQISVADENANQLKNLTDQIQSLINERDKAIMDKMAVESNSDETQRKLMALQNQVSEYHVNFTALSEEKCMLEGERERLIYEKSIIERERDNAIEKGGQGIREARGVIEVMRSNQDSTEKREEAISQQITALREDINRISEERNSLISETHELEEELRKAEQIANTTKEEHQKRVIIAEKEKEIAILEKENAIETSKLQAEELTRLVELERTHFDTMREKEQRIQDLEEHVNATQKESEEETLRLEAFSSQLVEMKERTNTILVERNALYDEKLLLQKEVESCHSNLDHVNRTLSDTNRENETITRERDELKQRCSSARDQIADISRRCDVITAERDQLVRERSASVAQSGSGTDRERALAGECEQKTKALVMMQKKLTAATTKIEKVTSQRNLFHRQRDEAGARLRAAGAEFSSLNEKLQTITAGRDSLQQSLIDIRKERDNSSSELVQMNEELMTLRLEKENAASELQIMEQLKGEVSTGKESNKNLMEQISILQQNNSIATRDASELKQRLEIALREQELAQSHQKTLEKDNEKLEIALKESQTAEADTRRKIRTLEVEITTMKEKTSLDLGITKAQLEAEKKISQETKQSLTDMQTKFESTESSYITARNEIISGMKAAKVEFDKYSLEETMNWPDIEETSTEDGSDTVTLIRAVQNCKEILLQVCRSKLDMHNNIKTLEKKQATTYQQTRLLEETTKELQDSNEKLHSIESKMIESDQNLQKVTKEKAATEHVIEQLQERLRNAHTQEAELRKRLDLMSEEMENQAMRRIEATEEERSLLLHDVEKAKTNLSSIWNMLQRSITSQQLDIMSEVTDEYNDGSETENIPVMALRATASLVAELERKTAQVESDSQKLATAEAEATRLIDRVEMAEHERDALRGANERLERKAKVAYQEGQDETQDHYEKIISQLKDETEDMRIELERASDKATRSEQETEDLRALCTKLTSQFNGRTNELDEAEERIVYLQDQVTTLEEDLQEAHERLRKHEAETAQARRADVDQLSISLDETSKRLEQIEEECTSLRQANEEAEHRARESEMAAETHRQAEENLQIAIEQLEAEQESAVQRRTIELQKKVDEAEARESAASTREKAATEAESKLHIRDEEIKELRGAIGRLADERVELKLELEKSLSRLNHPDSGGQLVDRRVVRQLLISYFRVGSVRRKDVLDLMSRMLAFSESDKVAVGLKRRALIDRLGSLVQPPELDDASLPPIGTVSDKWIEYLMKETEGEEEASKEGW